MVDRVWYRHEVLVNHYFSVRGANLYISCYTLPTGWDVEIYQLVTLLVSEFFDDLPIRNLQLFAYNVTMYVFTQPLRTSKMQHEVIF